ncbi:MAG: hypothetical protein HRU20_28205 [Pseudomonadales bacterium]|nr:hypothetical protein [Pseudomonadales bacterium]
MLLIRAFLLLLFVATLSIGFFLMDPGHQTQILNISQRLGFDINNVYHLLFIFCLGLLVYGVVKKWLSRVFLLALIVLVLVFEGTYLTVAVLDMDHGFIA